MPDQETTVASNALEERNFVNFLDAAERFSFSAQLVWYGQGRWKQGIARW